MRFSQLLILSIVILGLTYYLMAGLFINMMERSRRNQHRQSQIGKWSRNFFEEEDDTPRKLDDKGDEELEINLLGKIEQANKGRLERAEKVCKKYGIGLYEGEHASKNGHTIVTKYNTLIIDVADRITFCPTYNAGSSPWLYNLCILAGLTDKEIRPPKRQLIELTRRMYPVLEPEEAEEALSNTIKIMTVRHPFERLVAAYRKTLENVASGYEHETLHFYNKYGSRIVQKYRKNGNRTKTWSILKSDQYLWNPEMPKPLGVEPTFREFVQYLIDTDLVHDSNEQWIPYYLFCMTCQLKYDIIAMAETMNSDRVYYLRVLGLEDRISLSWQYRTQFISEYAQGDGVRVSKVAKIYFNQLYMRDVIKLYEKYKVDFEMFGYDHNDYIRYARDYKHYKPNKRNEV